MNWHDKVLDKSGLNSARRLAAALKGEFYLAGGTALALRLGHRISLDLDLFSTSASLDRQERTEIKTSLAASGPTLVNDEKDGTCHLLLEKTAVSLFRYPYKLLSPTEDWNGLRVASVPDIAAMKLSAVVGRGSRKDFIDLFFIFRQHQPEEIFGWAKRKFPDHPNFALQAGKALVYFGDAEKEPAPRMIKSATWREVKTYFEKEIPRYFRYR